MRKNVFERKIRIHAPAEAVFDWHAGPGALERLSPPWDPVTVVRKRGGIEKGAGVVLKVGAPPLPVRLRWVAEHTDYRRHEMFRDKMVKGPFSSWTHDHLFTDNGDGTSTLTDRIAYALPLSPVGDFIGSGHIRKKLEAIFAYRHDVTARDLSAHLSVKGGKPLHFLVSGASGVVGSSLVPFLTTGGHRVTRLVRRPSRSSEERRWDPERGKLCLEGLGNVDAVIHLAGENIGGGRWTPGMKRRIVRSRTRGTRLLAETVSRLSRLPRVFVCASAVGYYGERGDRLMTEADTSGGDFISHVCREWEEAAKPASDRGIRVVLARIGIALSPRGGALGKVLPLFTKGLGGALGNGNQYMSWVDMDDVVGAIHHAVFDPRLEGPVNIVAPDPVTNGRYTQVLAGVLGRPAKCRVPESLIRAAFGEMGKEVPLSSTRVRPGRLLETGYRFRYPRLVDSLSHQLGIVR